MKEADKIETKNWGVYEICMHCAQTISYAMSGYPKMKPALIRNTVGKIVITKFLKQGYMNHLLDTIKELEVYKGDLKPHSVFGTLSKEEYKKYFAMHISNHLLEVSIHKS